MAESPDSTVDTPPPDPDERSGDGNVLSPKMRLALYFTAGIFIALWASLEILGAAGFAAFVIGMIIAQLAWKARPHLNTAFAAGLAAYLVTLIIWSLVIGPTKPTRRDQAPTQVATEQSHYERTNPVRRD